ncbi:MAG: hypothetical protein CUN52_06080 [Phototrophicales bacterium]|nr:MAG: hypothetical protein CUN52_06080 [Phototrophicales bacterium]
MSFRVEFVRQQYATDEALRIRQEIHEKYTVPQNNFVEWVLSNIKWRGDEKVLDVGSGVGSYYKALRHIAPQSHYIGIDLSAGMLASHPAIGHVARADALRLPFPDHAFDVVMANHMVYHLSDIDAGLQEFRRVLKPKGVLLIATNSAENMPELKVLMRRAVVLLARAGAMQVQPPSPSSERFALENGTRHLHRYFYGVMRCDLPGKLVFPSVEPMMAYLESTRSLREPQLPEDVMWEDVMAIMRQQINHLINHLGELVINKLTGVLVATDSGAFMEEFIQIKSALEQS